MQEVGVVGVEVVGAEVGVEVVGARAAEVDKAVLPRVMNREETKEQKKWTMI
jgi:hypothetical protein